MMQTNYQSGTVLLLRINDVMSRTGLPRSSVYEKIKNKEITPPVAIGLRKVAWPSYEIDEINRALISGANNIQIKALVTRLTSDREQSLGGDDNE
ncbi:helix-turn-helix transcriptional regulator [Colwellia sp. Bg11-28]|uniref:helix-turn-helix transcriptional regulator n=1 Tax=Colwellia sp. Bg11-28 TaxID=2058305 RepID=UPI000C31F862|nr:AlpA family phage regulatory protein [Colwellia sp. Bg11-28]PKH88272.1 transcriptional regulator [Colwellia sp. Bg11-28]